MRKVSSEMCVSKGSQALLSGAQKHLIEITFKLRKRNSDDSSHTPQRGHTLRKSKERNILPQTEVRSQRHKSTRTSLRACVVVCLIISVASCLSLFTFLSRKRERNSENEAFRESEG